MNRLTIIGNLTRDPELRSTQDGTSVCGFSVAVNRPKKNGQDQGADYFNISAWRERGELCAKYLKKGSKVCVVGPVCVRLFTRQDGSAGASMEVTANEVEFLSSRGDNDQSGNGAAPAEQAAPVDAQSGFQQVETDELPFDRRVSLPE